MLSPFSNDKDRRETFKTGTHVYTEQIPKVRWTYRYRDFYLHVRRLFRNKKKTLYTIFYKLT